MRGAAASSPGDDRPLMLVPRSVLVLCLLIATSLFTSAVSAQNSFVIKDIRLEGLQRISAGTVFNYLPLQVGIPSTATAPQRRYARCSRPASSRTCGSSRTATRWWLLSWSDHPSRASASTVTRRSKPRRSRSSWRRSGSQSGGCSTVRCSTASSQELRRTYFASGRYGVQMTGTVTPLERNRVAVPVRHLRGQGRQDQADQYRRQRSVR